MAITQDKNVQIICGRCNLDLVKSKVKLTYLSMKFEEELYKCPNCNQVFVPEQLATGKILDVEMALEEK